jgi:hypothetical protein
LEAVDANDYREAVKQALCEKPAQYAQRAIDRLARDMVHAEFDVTAKTDVVANLESAEVNAVAQAKDLDWDGNVRDKDDIVTAIERKILSPSEMEDLVPKLCSAIEDRFQDFEAECSLTEKHMYLKLTVPQYQELVKEGDPVVPGLIVSNSEVGAGAFRVEPFLWRLVCKNGLIGTLRLYQIHLGQKLE